MNRQEYMKGLEHALKRLPKENREEVLAYYNEYFEEAGPEREAEVIEELGDAKETAAQILKEVAIKRLDEPERAARKGLSTIWLVILALCAAPIGLPILLVVLIFGLLAVFLVFVFFAVFFLVGGSLMATGVVSTVAGIYFLFRQPANGIFILGTGLAEFGIGLLLICVSCVCCRFIFKGLVGCARKLLLRGDKS